MDLTQSLRNEYQSLWNSCKIRPGWESNVAWYANMIEKYQARYKAVAAKTGVPWFIIACIHGMEGGFDFGTHLHNGDPLTARTVQVPAGRPRIGNPPFAWEDSAVDALNYDGASAIKNWDLPTCLWYMEGYNGWGYRQGAGTHTTPASRSAYIFSGTNHYLKGKYVADGRFDPNAVSEQVGVLAQLKVLEQRGLLSFSSVQAPQPTQPPKPTTYPANFPTPAQRPTLQAGSKGDWVKFLQSLLLGCGYQLTADSDFGPQTAGIVKKFEADVGIAPADSIVDAKTWAILDLHPKLPGWTPQLPSEYANQNGSSLNKKLLEFYKQQSNYDKVYDDVMGWYGTTSNGCVAFMSTALRFVGVPVPKANDRNGEGISLVTKPFAEWLQANGWKKITSSGQLQPGDVMFTVDNSDYPGYPAHTYLFQGWNDQANGIGWVIDNQAFTHLRNIFGYGTYNFSPFAYGLRAPI